MIKSKTKQCQNCKIKFTIEPEDFEFYKKIDVPEPTFCPDCRMQRRMTFRKEGPYFYKRKCDATGKNLISFFHPKSPIKIYGREYWWSDKWDAIEYGRDYDFNKPFFEQFKELFLDVPQIAISSDNQSVDSEYCASSNFMKNCYLVNNGGYDENISYSNRVLESKDSLDLYLSNGLELCYQNIYCQNSYKLFFSNHCDSCVESAFLYDCRNCQNCFGCVNLRNKKYHIFNKPYIKEEYFKKLKEFDLGSYENIVKYQNKYQELYQKAIHKFTQITKSVNCTGNEIMNAKNCHHSFDILKGLEDSKFANWAGYNCRDGYDVLGFGLNSELFYEALDGGLDASKNFFVLICWSCQDIQYSFNCHSSSNLFGCNGLRKKQYCIFNKQYSKKEYQELVPKIKKQMNEMPYIDKNNNVYKYGEFFPIEMSPYGYNETIANEYFSLTKEQALNKGYNWYDRPKSEYQATIKASDLPDHIKNTDELILKENIECGNKDCQGIGVFKIIPSELKFYQKLNISLPRLCPDCRYRERIGKTNPLKLWHRKCQCAGHQSDNRIYKNTIEHPHHKDKHCPNEFETSYSPDRKEIIYCEKCYNKEVG